MKARLSILFILSVIILAGTGQAVAQRSRGGIIVSEKKRQQAPATQLPPREADKPSAKVSAPKAKKPAVADTVYASAVERVNGWLSPIATRTKEQAAHVPQTFVFTAPNAEGRYTRMESRDAYGRYTPSGFNVYIAKPYSEVDSLANTDWTAKLKTACIYEFISDASGKHLLQERAYDENHRLIYSYSEVPLGEGDQPGTQNFVGSYKDAYGLPVEMRDDRGYSYGTLVMVTRDSRGYDVKRQYIDSKGVPKPNSDDAFAALYRYDDDGFLLSNVSIDNNGRYIIDNYGNSGMVVEWDKKMGEMTRQTYLDENLNPMVLYTPNPTSGNGIATQVWEYDDLGRPVEVRYYDTEGNPMENAYGTHRIVLGNDDRGNRTLLAGYALDGRQAPYDHTGPVVEEIEYDSEGRVLWARFYAVDGRPYEGDIYSRMEWEYDTDGKETSHAYYLTKDGKEEVRESYRITTDADGNVTETKEYPGEVRFVTVYDPKGRLIYDGNYDLQTQKVFVYPELGYAELKYTYEDDGPRTIVTSRWLDEKGRPINAGDFDTRIMYVDSIAYTKLNFGYLDGLLKWVQLDTYTPGFEELISNGDANRFGVPARAGSGAANDRFYQLKGTFTPFGSASMYYGVDEFGEPDYVVNVDGTIYNHFRRTKKGGEPRLEDGDMPGGVYDMRHAANQLPKIMTIEVIDSVGYLHGLKDNDVVVQWGDYVIAPEMMESEADFISRWIVRAVLDADLPREMVVFRIEDAKAGKFGLVKIALPAGTPSELGFAPHVRFLTGRQQQRIAGSIADNPEMITAMYSIPEGGKGINYAFPAKYLVQSQQFYNREIVDASILLGAYDTDRDLIWEFSKDMNTADPLEEGYLYSHDYYKDSHPERHYFVATKGGEVKHVVTTDWYGNFGWRGNIVSEEDYQKLLALVDKAQEEIKQLKKAHRKHKTEDFTGYWVAEADSSDYPATGYLYLDRDGSSRGNLSGYAKMEWTEGGQPRSSLFKTTKNWKGTWRTPGGDYLLFQPEEEYPYYECIYYTHADDKMSNEGVSAIVNRYPSDYDHQMRPLSSLSNLVRVVGVDKKQLLLSTQEGDTIRLIKQKGKPQTASATTPEMITDSNGIPVNLYGLWRHDEGSWSLTLSLSYVSEAGTSLMAVLNVYDPMSHNNGEFGFEYLLNGFGNWTYHGGEVTFSFDENAFSDNYDAIFAIDDDERKSALFEEACNKAEAFAKQIMEALAAGSHTLQFVSRDIIKIDGMEFQKQPERQTVVFAIVENAEGQLAKRGLEGVYLLVAYGDWDYTMGTDGLLQQIMSLEDKDKELILIPYTRLENGNDKLGRVQKVTLGPGKAGLRMMDNQLYTIYNIRNVESRLRMIK